MTWKPAGASKTPRINLPVYPTPFIGRQREVEKLRQLLRDPHCRLLILVGLGGIGKTRLAVETASQLQDDFADGAYFVPLTPVNSTRLIVPVIADAGGLHLRAPIAPIQNAVVQLPKGKAGPSSDR